MKDLDRAFPPTPECVEDAIYEGVRRARRRALLRRRLQRLAAAAAVVAAVSYTHLILAGGLSNLYDRLRYGYVIDFLEFGFVRFPVFNVADVCVVVGCALTFIAVLRAEGGKPHG